jgi:hypothetical protein
MASASAPPSMTLLPLEPASVSAWPDPDRFSKFLIVSVAAPPVSCAPLSARLTVTPLPALA